MLVAEKEVVDGNIGTSGLYFGIPDTKEKLPRKTIAAVSAFGVAIVTSLLLFGGCYRYNIYLKRELAGDGRPDGSNAKADCKLYSTWLEYQKHRTHRDTSCRSESGLGRQGFSRIAAGSPFT
jgi:hypothetical protein